MQPMGVSRLLVPLAVLGVGLSAAAAGQIRSRVDAVRVDVTVTSRTGAFVPNLTEADFEVFDNGRRQALSGFGAGAFPLRVAFVLDCSQSMWAHIEALRAAASVFVCSRMPADRNFPFGVTSASAGKLSEFFAAGMNSGNPPHMSWSPYGATIQPAPSERAYARAAGVSFSPGIYTRFTRPG